MRVGPMVVEAVWPSGTAAAVTSSAGESNQDRIWRQSLEGEERAYHGSYLEEAKWRARLNTVWHWYGGIGFNFWRCAGFIVIGMGLAGVLKASRPASVYSGMAIGGYAAGLVLVGVGMWPGVVRGLGRAIEMGPEARRALGAAAWTMRYLGAGCAAIGHIGVVMLLCRVEGLKGVLSPLAAAGRMALSNYLLQTVIAVLVFDGWAGGEWGKWTMSRIAMLVVGVWAFQLMLSPLWLKWFRFGPVEWAWRSATYGRVQAMRR